MKFADFINLKSVQAEMTAEDKPTAIKELVEGLARTGSISESEVPGIVAAIMKREELGSTGIGRGVAVPHTKHGSVERLVGTVGISVEGIDFNSLDGDKVHLLFLLVSPPDRPGDHLRALENISRQLRDENFCRYLKQARSVQDVQLLLDEADSNQFSS
jgi:PTS system fructose-specific IIA component/PTS system nitrogen regulatory IIA component